MTFAEQMRRRLGPDGVAIARRMAARPRRAARRVIDAPGGEQYGQLVGETDQRFGQQQDELARMQREVAVLIRRFDDFEDYQGSRYEEAARAIQGHLVRVEELVRSVERLKADITTQLDAINAQLARGDSRLDGFADRLEDLAGHGRADGPSVHADPAELRPGLRSLRPPAT